MKCIASIDSALKPGPAACGIVPNPGPVRQRRVVVVLGMHRSGTSLLTNLLTSLGVDVGTDLLGPDEYNQAGYFEQAEISRTHDELLEAIDSRWSPAWTRPFPVDWSRVDEFSNHRKQLTEAVYRELSKTDRVWAFKDPRMSRLLPLWNQVFAELDVEPTYLLAIRHPSAVVESVIKRDGLSATHAEWLWLLHNLDAVRDAGDCLGVVVDYERWFTDDCEQARAVARALGAEWPANDNGLLSTMRERIRPDLRHCSARRAVSLPYVTRVYRLLLEAATTGTMPKSIRVLDAEVRRALALCEPWLAIARDDATSIRNEQDGTGAETAARMPARLEFRRDP